jgi:type I site-specific restriction endonuclease
VIRVGLNIDLEGWRPEVNKKDLDGDIVEDREYNQKDFDRNLVAELVHLLHDSFQKSEDLLKKLKKELVK